MKQKNSRWVLPSIIVYVMLLVLGATAYEARPGLQIDAPIITPTNPELR